MTGGVSSLGPRLADDASSPGSRLADNAASLGSRLADNAASLGSRLAGVAATRRNRGSDNTLPTDSVYDTIPPCRWSHPTAQTG